MTIFTIGHSTRSLDDFIALLQAHGINCLADIRTVPKSRRHPHFAGDALAQSLPAQNIVYRHFPGLGGLRKPRRDSTNTGWRHEGFRGYADYMQTVEFARALDELIHWADDGECDSGSGRGGMRRRRSVLDTPERYSARACTPDSLEPLRGAYAPGNSGGGGVPAAIDKAGAPRVVIMCAEAVWWRCHRQLVADALVARGIEVRHIASVSSAPSHTLTAFARVDAERVSYPGLL